jgi:hypothetical protein
MLNRRVCASVRSAISTPSSATAVNSRSFAAFTAAQSPVRAPALADLKPNGASSFTQKQKEFRDGIVAAQKKKEQAEC